MRKINRFMEFFWLTIAIGTAIAAGWVIATAGFEEGKQWLIFPGISIAMYIFRRMTRRKLEALDDRAKAAKG